VAALLTAAAERSGGASSAGAEAGADAGGNGGRNAGGNGGGNGAAATRDSGGAGGGGGGEGGRLGLRTGSAGGSGGVGCFGGREGGGGAGGGGGKGKDGTNKVSMDSSSGHIADASSTETPEQTALRRLCLGALRALAPSLWLLLPRRMRCAPLRTAVAQALTAALAGAGALDAVCRATTGRSGKVV